MLQNLSSDADVNGTLKVKLKLNVLFFFLPKMLVRIANIQKQSDLGLPRRQVFLCRGPSETS